jgi:carbonic anhydrase
MNRLLASLLVACFLMVPSLRAQEAMPTAEAALKRLQEGNARFVADKTVARDTTAKHRAELAKGQHPFAVVVACADSRVTPELVFDQGLGDLFVLRVAGNITDPDVLGSIEFAAQNLKSPLIVVLGHESCGAVAAAIAGEPIPGNLGKLIEQVKPGKDLPKEKDAALAAGVRGNVLYQTAQITEKSPVLKELAGTKRIQIVSGVYSLKTGEITWLQGK